MELEKLFGLPAHPLVVHLPIVLIPLAAVGAVAIAVHPPWRARLGWVVVGLAGVALVGVQMAMSSGEALEEHVDETKVLERHADMAASMRPLAALFFVGLLALVWLDHRRRRQEQPSISKLVMQVVAGVTIVLSLVTTARLVQVGHNGAKATWQDVNVESKGHADEDE